jgi:Ca2+-binding RTX toxin-like protein
MSQRRAVSLLTIVLLGASLVACSNDNSAPPPEQTPTEVLPSGMPLVLSTIPESYEPTDRFAPASQYPLTTLEHTTYFSEVTGCSIQYQTVVVDLSGQDPTQTGNDNANNIVFTGASNQNNNNRTGTNDYAFTAVAVAAGHDAQFQFTLAENNASRGDVSWTVQRAALGAPANGAWTAVTGSGMSGSSAGTFTTGELEGGFQYRLMVRVADTSNTNGNNGVYNVTLSQFNLIDHVDAPATGYIQQGAAEIINTTEELGLALRHGLDEINAAGTGKDIITGGAGNDVIFGDTVNVEHLFPDDPEAAVSGLQGLQTYLTGKAVAEDGTVSNAVNPNQTPSAADVYSYIRAHADELGLPASNGGGSDDTINAGAGNDVVYGQGGNDTIIGGAGDDILSGGDGSDTFVWRLADHVASASKPDVDTIMDFGAGDALDLRDLLPDMDDDDLGKYLSIRQEGTDVILDVSTQGGFSSDGVNANAGKTDQQIVLQGHALTDFDEANSTSIEIINQMINDAKLKVDHH